MKKSELIAIMAAGIALAGVSACNNRLRKGESVENFAIDITIKKAAGQLELTDSAGGDKAYANLTAEINWPEKLGSHSITPLQDTIKSRLFGASAIGERIDAGIERYIAGEPLSDDGVIIHKIDSISAKDDEMAWQCNLSSSITDLTTDYITYVIKSYAFTGGAHGDTSINIFSYDLETSTVLTPERMFRPGSEAIIISAIKEALAADMETTVDGLAKKGIFIDELESSIGQPYISDGQICFLYNAYEIAPYYMGSITVEVNPYTLREILTPTVRRLTLDN